MLEKTTYSYDATSSLNVGKREQQEDAVASDFGEHAALGFVVLADGMGGHAAGEIASEIVVNEVYGQIKHLAVEADVLESNLDRVLRQVVRDANARLGWVAQANPSMNGMGSTVIAPIVFENRLYWISVGDSPLFLFRGSRLFRLNENHSVASLVDNLAMQGKITAETARHHPDRSCLTSVINGSVISEIDCRSEPFQLEDGDILVAASDGLETIGEKAIAHVLFDTRDLSSASISKSLMDSVSDLDHPDQDNVSLCVMKIAMNSQETFEVALDNLVSSAETASDQALGATVDNVFAESTCFEAEGGKQ